MVRRLKLGLDGIDFPRIHKSCSIFVDLIKCFRARRCVLLTAVLVAMAAVAMVVAMAVPR